MNLTERGPGGKPRRGSREDKAKGRMGRYWHVFCVALATGRFRWETETGGKQHMSARISNILHTTALHSELDRADPIAEPAMRRVPEKPTLEMLTAASVAAGIPIATVWTVWQAMLKAAD